MFWNTAHWEIVSEEDKTLKFPDYIKKKNMDFRTGPHGAQIGKLEIEMRITDRYCAVLLTKRQESIPAILFASYHGQNSPTKQNKGSEPLTERTKLKTAMGFLELASFTAEQYNIPLLVGGDFNVDLSSFSLGQAISHTFETSRYTATVKNQWEN